MTDDEKRAYSRGYAAGRKRLDRDLYAERREQRRAELWNQAFLASFPVAMQLQGWHRTVNGTQQKITSLDDRVRLARDFADEAMKYMRSG